MRFVLLTFFMVMPLCAQTSATLSTAQYRSIYSAAQLIESAKACGLDWKSYHDVFVYAQKKAALAEGWSLENQARVALQLGELRQRLATQQSAACSQERQDSLAVRLEVEKERLTAEADPNEDTWVLKPRGRNWLYIYRVQFQNAQKSLSGQEAFDARESIRQYQLSNNWGINGKVTWINALPGSEKRYSKPWIAANDITSPSTHFLNMRPLFYQDEALDVLALQAQQDHILYKQAVDLARSGDITGARELFETLDEDSYVINTPGYWILRAHLENQRGSRSRAREYLKSIAKVRKLGSRVELMMRQQLVALGDKSQFYWDSSFLGLVVEIAWKNRVEVLAMYVDGTIILADSEGGGLIVESFINQRRIWDVQGIAVGLIRRRSVFQDTPLGMSRYNSISTTLPEQDKLRLSFLNGRSEFSEEYDIRLFEEDKSDFWFSLRRLYAVLQYVYDKAEVDR